MRVVLEGGLFLLLKQTLLLLLLLAGWVLCTHVLLYSAEGGREGEREMLCAAALLLHRCFRDFANQATASLRPFTLPPPLDPGGFRIGSEVRPSRP